VEITPTKDLMRTATRAEVYVFPPKLQNPLPSRDGSDTPQAQPRRKADSPTLAAYVYKAACSKIFSTTFPHQKIFGGGSLSLLFKMHFLHFGLQRFEQTFCDFQLTSSSFFLQKINITMPPVQANAPCPGTAKYLTYA
jgi:hypothetical protein